MALTVTYAYYGINKIVKVLGQGYPFYFRPIKVTYYKSDTQRSQGGIGKPYMKIPLPETEAMGNLLSALGEIITQALRKRT
jgi:hypothetical protein